MTNKAKKQSALDGRAFLRERLIDVEAAFADELRRYQKQVTHDGTMGDATEDAWIELLRRYLPTRYRVAKAFVVDHLGHTTDQLDCLIFDAHFTPALFGKDKHLYVPAEAVYATFEVKQTIDATDLKYAAAKVQSLRALKRTSAPLENAAGKSEPKVLFPILGGLLGMNASWKKGLGPAFLKQLKSLKLDKELDLVLTAESGFCSRLAPEGAPSIVTGKGSLIRGLFWLLRALRSKSTVAAVDWEKYEAVLAPRK